MSIYSRSLIAFTLLGLCLVVQGGLAWHATAAGALQDVSLKQPLETAVPRELGDWVGQDAEISDLARYGDDYLKRHYIHRKTGQVVTLWMAYSRHGEDRGHHPEICLTASGQAENPRGKQSITVAGQDGPIQQYLYGRQGKDQWIYYWHYTLKDPQMAETSVVQRLYQRSQRRESSVTLEVFAPNSSENAREGAVEFVTLIDQLMQQELPQPAIRDCRRAPVQRIDAH